MNNRLLLLIISVFCFTLLRAQSASVKKSPVPSWVTVPALNYNVTNFDKQGEDGYIDLDAEKQTNLAEKAVYNKVAIKILSETGVENKSDVTVDFDPTYQQLTFHTINIIRNGKVINKLNLSKIELLQQEKELKMHLYNGALSAYLLLDDVRKGDIIEYSYTIKGFNPVFDKYSAILETQYGVPVYNIYYKIIAPETIQLSIKNVHTNITPKVVHNAGVVCYEWTLKDVAPLPLDDNTPSWYDPYSSVMVSEYRNWGEVSAWAANLFPFGGTPGSELQKRINEWNKLASEEDKVTNALRFVQDEVRYMGVEMGKSSHKPNSPDKVFAQRYGDCKDKSYLLCSILRNMGIDAKPVLINTSYKKTIKEWLPSARIFDHVTVMVVLKGKTYFLDPTSNYQRGKLDDLSYPDYQVGLVVGGANDLIVIPNKEKGVLDTREIFTVDLVGFAYLKVITKRSGQYADIARSDFQSTTKAELLESYRKFYQSYFDNITADSLSYLDDEASGVFTTYEYYRIQKVWSSNESGRKIALFEPYLVNSAVKKYQEGSRTMPMNMNYPLSYHEVIEINLPEPWPVKDISDTYQCAAFKLSYSMKCTGNQTILDYNYDVLKDNVDVAEAASYKEAYKKIDDYTGFSISFNNNGLATGDEAMTGTRKGVNRYNLLYTVMALFAFVVFVIRRTKRRRD